MADISIIADYSSVKAANKELLKVGSTAQKSAAVYTQAFKAVDAENKRQLKSVRDQISFSQKMERQKANAARASVAAAQLVAKEEERLKNKFVQGYTAMDIYSKELNDLAMARKKDIISTKQQSLAVAALNKDLAAGTGVFATQGQHTDQLKRRTNQLGVMMQQTGYQVGDFAVQVGSGQNVMVAFGQQATQLVGTMAMFAKTTKMIAVFSGLGIAIPILSGLAAAWMRVNDAAKDSSDSLDDVADKAKAAVAKIKDLREELRMYVAGFKTEEELTLSDQIKVATDRLALMRDALKVAEAEASVLKTTLDGFAGVDVSSVPTNAAAANLSAEKAAAAEREAAAQLETLQTLMQQNDLKDRIIDREEENLALASEGRALALAETSDMKDKVALALLIFTYGEDSLQVREKETAIAREAYRLELALSGVKEDSLNTLLESFDQLNKIESQTLSWANAMGSVRSEIEGIMDSLSDIGGGIIGNVSKAAELAALKAGKSIKAAAVVGDRVALEAEWNARSVNANPAEKFIIGAERGNFEYGVELDAALDAAREAAREADKAANKTATKGSTSETGLEAAEKLLREAKSKQKVIGLTQEQAHYEELLFKMQEDNAKKRDPLTQIELKGYADKIHAIQEQTLVLEEAKQQQEELADYIANSMGDALMSVVDGTMTVKDAFKAMATDIIKELYRVLVVQQLVNSAKTAMGFFADGGAFSGGSQIQAYANGGVVGGPTTFPMAGGKTGLMGEAGPEAIMPLKRGANGKLGVQMEGGGGDTIVVNQSFNFQSNGDATIKQLIAQAAPKIAQMTKSSLLDDRRRGGSTKAAFG
jgi:hypothetical protein